MEWNSVNELCDVVRKTGLDIYRYHRSGHLEKVYENALAHRLRKLGLDVKQQYRLIVYDEDGTEIGEYFADLFIEGQLIVELKACKAVGSEQVAQILGYLRASGIENGLLINFGAPRFFIKKYILSRNPSVVQATMKNLILGLCASCASLWPFIR